MNVLNYQIQDGGILTFDEWFDIRKIYEEETGSYHTEWILLR